MSLLTNELKVDKKLMLITIKKDIKKAIKNLLMTIKKDIEFSCIQFSMMSHIEKDKLLEKGL